MSDVAYDLRSVVYRDGPITDEDYDEAIEALYRAKRQPEQLHLGCSICEDSGHTASICHHNPLAMARKYAAATGVWSCYHCGYVAHNDEEGVEHFGPHSQEHPVCQTGSK